MMGEGCEGELEAIHLEGNQSNSMSFHSREEFSQNVEAIYCVKGQVKLKISIDNSMILDEGDIILITKKGNFSDLQLEMYNLKDEKAHLIRTSIHY
ncbi:hypothetical protein SAMN05660472_00795 [Natronincola ferrireducens]|uniref:Cupin domain-containing protein n=2 Tax=Natronincola ferrireducens TaxID=393762 RepID=A0A1G8ZDC4_9FIRM|nr:hypothetical protein SAMN05660472_00795 [Natronincola ferrireducens]